MAASSLFDFLAERLEDSSPLDRLQARGTLRIAMKEAGLEARSVGRDQARVVLERVLPRELLSRGITEADVVCKRLVASLADAPDDVIEAEGPEAVFARLGG